VARQTRYFATGRKLNYELFGNDMTSLGATVYAEAYWNGGWLVVCIAGLFIGIAYSVIGRLALYYMKAVDLRFPAGGCNWNLLRPGDPGMVRADLRRRHSTVLWNLVFHQDSSCQGAPLHERAGLSCRSARRHSGGAAGLLGRARNHFKNDRLTLLSDAQQGKRYVVPHDLLKGAGIFDDFMT